MKPQVLTISTSARAACVSGWKAGARQQLRHRLRVDGVLGAAQGDQMEAGRATASPCLRCENR